LNINATFFIQLIHFLIGYIIIERLLLSPWVKVIHNESNQIHEQEKLVTIAQERLFQKEQFKQEQWREFQIAFAQAMPHVHLEPKVAHVKKAQELSAQKIDPMCLDATKKEIEQLLIARLAHD